jgi:hypothetical protein
MIFFFFLCKAGRGKKVYKSGVSYITMQQPFPPSSFFFGLSPVPLAGLSVPLSSEAPSSECLLSDELLSPPLPLLDCDELDEPDDDPDELDEPLDDS